jgi:hypothetical protein
MVLLLLGSAVTQWVVAVAGVQGQQQVAVLLALHG